MSIGSNVVANGFVESLAKPGGNITGITTPVEETIAKVFEIMRELLPAMKRVGFVVNADHPSAAAFVNRAQSACDTLGLSMVRSDADGPEKFAEAFARIASGKVQAAVFMPDVVFWSNRQALQEHVRKAAIPSGFAGREHVTIGGLFSYATDLRESCRYAAGYVDKILRGARPQDLPVEQAPRYELMINLKTARELGLKIPQNVLLRADEVIE
jgi:putative ABC transport system substrate-binding protein